MGLPDSRLTKASDKRMSDAERTRDRLVSAGKTLLSTIYKTPGVMDIDQEANAAQALAVAEFEARAATEKDKNPTVLARTRLVLVRRVPPDKRSSTAPSKS